MTDITEQDRRAARKWAENWRGDIDNDTSAAARVILATVDAPPPTLAEELRALNLDQLDESALDYLAARAEQERDQALSDLAEMTGFRDSLRTDLDHARAELNEACDELANSEYDRHNLHAEVERLTAEWDDRPAADLPDPADVPAGQPWEVVATDPAKKIGGGITKHNAVAFRMTDRWVVSRNGYQTPLVVPDDCVSLVRRLVPSPRTITSREELDGLPEATVIRDADGMICERADLGIRGMQWLAVGIDENYPVQNPTLPAMVLWTPEVTA